AAFGGERLDLVVAESRHRVLPRAGYGTRNATFLAAPATRESTEPSVPAARTSGRQATGASAPSRSEARMTSPRLARRVVTFAAALATLLLAAPTAAPGTAAHGSLAGPKNLRIASTTPHSV